MERVDESRKDPKPAFAGVSELFAEHLRYDEDDSGADQATTEQKIDERIADGCDRREYEEESVHGKVR